MANIVLKLARPIKAASVCGSSGPRSNAQAFENAGELEAQKKVCEQACQTIQAVADKFKENYETIFSQRNEEIAKLAVEIARKVLMQAVDDGNYKIEEIVKEILKSAPAQHDLVVHLNPKDLAGIQGIGADTFSGVTFVPDNNIGRAECMLESPRGIIKSLIDEHLEQIGRALKRAG